MQSLNAAALNKVLSSPAVRAVVLKQLDSDIGNVEKQLASLKETRSQLTDTPAKPAKKASAAAPTRRKAKTSAKKSSSAKKSAAASKRGPGRPKGSKNRRSGHTKAILDALGQYENGTAKAAEIRETCAEAGHKMASGIFHSTVTALQKQGRVSKEGERSDAVYSLVAQEPASAPADAADE